MINTAEVQSVKQRFGIIGNSPILLQAIERAILVASTDMSVLITGESGSGKESFSKIIHHLSPRRHQKFIAINCGAIPEGTINSELFGHEKGAFTGANEARKGYFEEVDGGTIFLDEIGEMPLETQARLLRVLEYGEFIRVGASKVQKTNVRVIAATNVNLLQAIETKKFREDLFYRLSTMPIYVPPLRERGTDVLLLFRKFATDFAEKYHTEPIELNEEAKKLLLTFRFPGNIRQLKNLAEQLSVVEYERVINPEMLLRAIPQEQRTNALMLAKEAKNSYTTEEGLSERDIFYKVLLDMRKDVTELKKLVLQILQNGGSLNADILHTHQELFKNLPDIPENTTFMPLQPLNNPLLLELSPTTQKTIDISNMQEKKNNTQDIYEEGRNSLSIEQKEKELIIKALQKNKNRRKNAAEELGISERTLYRKIKQYNLE